MKTATLLFLIAFPFFAQSQDVHYLKPIEMEGTDVVVLPSVSIFQTAETLTKVLFLNTQSGVRTEFSLPHNCEISQIEQIRIESLKLNKILIIAQNGRMAAQGGSTLIYLLGPDGNLLSTESLGNRTVSSHVVNEHSGNVVLVTSPAGITNLGNPESVVVYDAVSGKLKS
jgi:hypothetical protein